MKNDTELPFALMRSLLEAPAVVLMALVDVLDDGLPFAVLLARNPVFAVVEDAELEPGIDGAGRDLLAVSGPLRGNGDLLVRTQERGAEDD